jgi:beta-glucanase (GH16 family)
MIFSALLLLPLSLFAAWKEGGGWKLVWGDEFNKEGAPDPAKWDYETGFVRNGEAQYYTRDRRENARVEAGHLLIEARKEAWPNPSFKKGSTSEGEKREKADYTSASLMTNGKFSWTYGRVEVRAKLPGGRGTWPAAWSLGVNIGQAGWPGCGEIDIMEYVGFAPGKVYATIHTKAFNHMINTQKGVEIPLVYPDKSYHLYAAEWDANKIEFFVDGKSRMVFKNDKMGMEHWPFDQPQYLILNTAIGGGWGGMKGIDDSIFPAHYEIDYVRIFQKK